MQVQTDRVYCEHMKTLVTLIMSLILEAITVVVAGVVVFYCWRWFITPVFVQLPNLSIKQAIGIMIAVSFPFTISRSYAVQKPADDKSDNMTFTLLKLVAVVFLIIPVEFLGMFVWHLVLS